VAALSALAVLGGKQVFTVREVFEQMLTTGTSYMESTVFKTMQRMKAPAARPPYAQLERGATGGFHLLGVGADASAYGFCVNWSVVSNVSWILGSDYVLQIDQAAANADARESRYAQYGT
jgi:hypothetical protein